MKDLKGMYQAKVDELAQEKYGAEFYDLQNATQLTIYNQAEELVNDGLIDKADSLREEMEIRGVIKTGGMKWKSTNPR